MAGLCASAQLRAAARLLRSAEALSHAAVAALCAFMSAQSTSLETAGAPMSGQAAGQTRRRRRRKKVGKNAADSMDDGNGAGDLRRAQWLCLFTSRAIGCCGYQAPAAAGCQNISCTKRSTRRVADKFRSPSSTSTYTGAVVLAADDVFAKDSLVLLSGLASRPELNSVQATVLSFDDVGGRYAVRLSSVEDIHVPAANMKPIFGPVF